MYLSQYIYIYRERERQRERERGLVLEPRDNDGRFRRQHPRRHRGRSAIGNRCGSKSGVLSIETYVKLDYSIL